MDIKEAIEILDALLITDIGSSDITDADKKAWEFLREKLINNSQDQITVE